MVQSLKSLNQVKLAAMIGTAVVMIAFFAYISLRVAAPTMAPLYNSVPVEDGGKIISELELENVPYELRRNGTQILVPSDQVDKLRLTLAQKGLPSQGSIIGYEIFDKANTLGTSNFVLNINQMRALEGELSRTIASFDTVENARVHLVSPKRELFSREANEPTASVAVKLRGASGLTKNEIAAIRNLVASAVPGLKAQRVTVVDSRGVMLAKGVDTTNDPNAVSEDAESFRSEYEKNTVERLERLLEQSVGMGKVKAEVHAEIDFNRTVMNSEKYDPEGQVARSVQTVKEDENANEKNADPSVSASNNLPAAQAGGGAGTTNATNRKRTEETTNFEISKQVTNSIKEAGVIKRLSVAILVDGTYTPDAAGKLQFAPRSEEEIKKLEKLVQSSIGYDATRGDDVSVVTMQFAAPPADIFATSPFDWLKQDFNSIIQTLVLGGVAILSILLVIRPLVARAIESAEMASKEDEMEQAALAAPSIAARLMDQSRKTRGDEDDDAPEEQEDMINIDRIQGKLRSSSYTKINNMVDKHPDETAQILRQWLTAS
ncbi:MAG: flagellar M-ring protein FliF [Rickettsiales bacterium]|nr:flagellar M-ring protein FliF [Rickettsiales bacterium]